MMIPHGGQAVFLSTLYHDSPDATNKEKTGWQDLKNAVEEAGHMLTDETKIPWEDHFVGFSDYIDGIRSSDLTHPVMWGIDPRGRKLLCFRTLSYPKFKPMNKSVATLVIFERYSSNSPLAKSSQNYEPDLWDKTDPYQIDPLFKKFMNGETVELTIGGKITCFHLDTERDEDAKCIDFQVKNLQDHL